MLGNSVAYKKQTVLSRILNCNVLGGFISLVLIFPFFPANAFNVGSLYHYSSIAVSMGIIFYYLVNKKNSISLQGLTLLGFAFVLVLSCAINDKSIIPGIYYGSKIAAFYLLFELAIKRSHWVLLRTTRLYLCFLLIVALFYQIVNPAAFGYTEAMNYQNFFASDNDMGYQYIGLIALSAALDYRAYGKITFWTIAISGMCMASVCVVWAAKAVVGIAICLIVVVVARFRSTLLRIVKLKGVVISYVVIYFSVVVFRAQEQFASFIEVYFQKDATLSGRAAIWDSAFQQIQTSPVIGQGVVNGGRLIINANSNGVDMSSHNLFLEVILQTGFVGFALFVLFLVLCMRGGRHQEKTSLYGTLLLIVFAALIMYIASPTLYLVGMYLPLVLLSNIDKFMPSEKVRDKQ